jgi:hypothetical protein
MEKTKKEVKEVKINMNRYHKTSIILAILIAVALFSDFLATQNAPTPRISPFEPRRLPTDRFIFDRYSSVRGDIELFYKVKTILSSINATLLVFLLATYIDIYKKLRSEFTVGLIIFSLILLLYALSSNPLLHWLFGFRAFGLGPFAMLPDLFTTLALSVLLYLTVK